MLLTAGTRIGVYEVVAPLGAGGMGEVYRARDTKLNREVALKVLPESVAHDPDRLARFRREAQVLASLNHPNIGAIYGFEESDNIQALVLELVEGPTLADRIAQGPIPLDDALPLAKQIAEALEGAHDQGIIHRDLKPANIKLRPDGTVKVLDFGLAKALAGDPLTSPASLMNSPTLTSPVGITGVGVLLGTAAYMAPEQVRGRAVDKRADVWAFGCVLFEMLTGKRCFDGEDISLTLAEVIKSEPNWNTLPAAATAAVRSTLKHCLQKDPKLRVRDIADVRLALDGAFAGTVSHSADRPWWASSGRPFRLASAAAAAGTLVGGVVVAAILYPGSASTPTLPIDRFTVALPAGSEFRDNTADPLALTKDGRRLVMKVRSGEVDRVFVRAMDQLQPQAVPGLEGIVGSIFLSSDGEWIAYNDANGSLKRMRIAGGPPATIAPTGITTGGWQGGTWGSAGTIVFATATSQGLMEVPEAGGTPTLRTKPPENEVHAQPHFLPDGRSLLFTVRSAGQPTRVAYLPGNASVHTLLLEGTNPRYVATGHLLFTRETGIWAVAFDAGSGRIVGDPAPVLEGVQMNAGGVAKASVSADGTLAYVSGGPGSLRSIVLADRKGSGKALPGLAPNAYENIRLSPNGRVLAFDAGRPRSRRVWTYDLARSTIDPVTPSALDATSPLWTVDGKRIVFLVATQNGRFNLWSQNADGTGFPEPLLLGNDSEDQMRPDDWSPDGSTLLLTLGRAVGPDIMAVDLRGDRQPRSFIGGPAIQAYAAISPDGHWVAFQSDHSGGPEIYIERFPKLGDRKTISNGGGMAPRWSADGRELFYLSRDGRRVIAVPILKEASTTAGTPPSITPGNPETLFEGSYLPAGAGVRPFEVTRDGRFLLIKPEPTGDPNTGATVTIVRNWGEELKRLVPPAGRR